MPSIHLEGDTDYAFSIFNLNNDACMIWLNANETRSLVSVSFGSSASLNAELMSEMVQALRQNGNNNFLWVAKTGYLSILWRKHQKRS